MWRINASVVILDHFSLFKSELGGVEANGIFVGDLYMERNFVHLLGHAGILFLVKFVRARIDAVAVVQHGLDQLSADPASPVSSQDGQSHNVQSVLDGSGAFVFGIVAIALHGFNASTDGADHKAVVVGKFVEMFIVAFDHILIEAFVVGDRERDSVYFAELTGA